MKEISKRSFPKSILMILIILLSIVYIINPTAGLFELIPDNMPFVGNLDEATAVWLLLNALSYFGLDLTRFFSGKKAGP